MTLDLHVQPSCGKSTDGQMQEWIEVHSRDLQTREHCIPCTPDTRDVLLVRLNKVIMESYQAGQRDGKSEIRQALCDLIGAKSK